MKSILWGLISATVALCLSSQKRESATNGQMYYWAYTPSGFDLVYPTELPPNEQIFGCGAPAFLNCSLSATGYTINIKGDQWVYMPQGSEAVFGTMF